MKHASLFSGIGGFDLAAEWAGMENVFQVEIDQFCQKVLEKNFPNTKRYGDIKKFDGTAFRGAVDIISGGFPCQPFSQAGKRRGTEDDRYLWPEMLRIIREVQPKWVVGENVAGLITWSEGMVFEQVCADLEAEGYEVQPLVIPACAVNAPHRRDRIWFIANSKFKRSICSKPEERTRYKKGIFKGIDCNASHATITGQLRKKEYENNGKDSNGGRGYDPTDKDSHTSYDSLVTGLERHGDADQEQEGWKRETRPITEASWQRNWIEVATELCGVDDGLSARMDGLELSKSRHRKERLRSLGNAIVPQVAYQIFKAILRI